MLEYELAPFEQEDKLIIAISTQEKTLINEVITVLLKFAMSVFSQYYKRLRME